MPAAARRALAAWLKDNGIDPNRVTKNYLTVEWIDDDATWVAWRDLQAMGGGVSRIGQWQTRIVPSRAPYQVDAGWVILDRSQQGSEP